MSDLLERLAQRIPPTLRAAWLEEQLRLEREFERIGEPRQRRGRQVNNSLLLSAPKAATLDRS